MHTVEGLGKIYKVLIESSLPFGTLFNNISQLENMIDTTPSSPETCLFLAEFKVHSEPIRESKQSDMLRVSSGTKFP